MLLNTALILLRLGNQQTNGGYFIQYRANLEIGAYNAIPCVRKKLEVLPHTTHMTLYSDKSKVEDAAKMATGWFVETL